jgi:predicted acyltransferase
MSSTGASQRLMSLDAFRGATIAGMILVNNPGSWSTVYPQLLHAHWNGWTFTDWIFPFFLWIVGVAMTFSFAKRVERGDNRTGLMLHVLRRSAIIFGLGLFMAAFPFGLIGDHHFSLGTLRIPGVLQRIAVCYLIASAIFLTSSRKGQVAWILGLLVSYWMLVKLVPVPGYGPGVLEPTGSLCWWVDSHVLAGHTWRGAPVPGFDPEGIVSTIPAIATTLMGVMTGHLLRSGRSKEEKTVWMFVAGMLLLLLGVVLDMWLPINKNLWTSSYTIFMAGWANVCLAMFYWFIDVRGASRWATPFVIYGMNAIAVFVLSGLVAKLSFLISFATADGGSVSLKSLIYESVFAPLGSPMNASVAFALSYVVLFFGVAWIMWKRQWFLKV